MGIDRMVPTVHPHLGGEGRRESAGCKHGRAFPATHEAGAQGRSANLGRAKAAAIA